MHMYVQTKHQLYCKASVSYTHLDVYKRQLQRKITEGLIAHQHGNLLNEGTELIGSCGFIAQNGNLVLNQRVVKYHYVIQDVYKRQAISTPCFSPSFTALCRN